MKKSRVFGVLLGIVIIVSGVVLLLMRGNSNNKAIDYNVMITKWDNLYKGNNIQFYYMSKDNVAILNLKNKYSLDNVVKDASNELEKTMAMIDWLNRRAEVKTSAMESKKTVDEMLIALETNKVISLKEYNIILEETLTSIGVICRSGELRASNNVKIKENDSYSVLEIWSSAHGKWVMIDGKAEGYLMKDGIPLSAIEVINSEIETITSENIKEPKKYLKAISKYLSIYSIKIDNNKLEEAKSNSYITFVSRDEDIQLETIKGYIQPTIFVKDQQLFNVNPEVVYHNGKSDSKPTLILAKRNTKDDTEEYTKFTVGAFMNSYMLDSYFLSVNGGEYTPVKTYYDLALPSGKTAISVSLDGKTQDGFIEFEGK
ncbi:hypothetical protein [Clostridium sp.]|uniref:hypothetical protein n=1 Tax=Clostridium sp. TaxID=1506 RepID=UPI002FC58EBF